MKTFISKAWGCRFSDKHLTEHWGFLSNLLPGDYILADKGFKIEDSTDIYFAVAHKTAAFTRGKKTISPMAILSIFK